MNIHAVQINLSGVIWVESFTKSSFPPVQSKKADKKKTFYQSNKATDANSKIMELKHLYDQVTFYNSICPISFILKIQLHLFLALFNFCPFLYLTSFSAKG